MTIIALLLTLVASNLPNIVTKEGLGFVPPWLTAAKVAILLIAAVCLWRSGSRQLANYGVALAGVIGFSYLLWLLGGTAAWQQLFRSDTFFGHHANFVFNKLLSAVPLVALLLWLLKSPQEAYLVGGDLSVKAEPIRWLGIHPDWISWRKLSLFSAFAIAGGTLLLTLFTVTGFSLPQAMARLPSQLPGILLLALVNSIGEGFLFRNAVLGPLRSALPKEHLLLIAALFFGLAHFYGIPSGYVGVFMSGVLGWFLCRSMYETGGLLAPWIIHFMQDAVIFATLFLLGVWI